MDNNETANQIRQCLLRDPEASNRLIAAELSVRDKQVALVRAALESSGEIAVVPATRGIDGKLRPRRRSSKKPAPPPQLPAQLIALPFLESRYGKKSHGSPSPKVDSPILSRIRTAFSSHPLAFLVALPFGGFVPLAVWCMIHLELLHWWHWTMVAGGALFSSLTVISWGRQVFANLPKAVGFAVLVEGVMVASQIGWLSVTALLLLTMINSTASAVSLAGGECVIRTR